MKVAWLSIFPAIVWVVDPNSPSVSRVPVLVRVPLLTVRNSATLLPVSPTSMVPALVRSELIVRVPALLSESWLMTTVSVELTSEVSVSDP